MHLFDIFLLISTIFLSNSIPETIKVSPPIEKHDISPHLIGFNNNWVRETDVWQNSNMRLAFRESQSSSLRYPGGTNSSYWDFDNNTVFKDLDPNLIKANWIKDLLKKDFSNPVEELGLLKKDIGEGFAVIFVANLITGQNIPSAIPESMSWYAELDNRYAAFKRALQRAEAVGIPIQYVELGNEYYFLDGYIGKYRSCATCPIEGAFPDSGSSYAVAANYFAKKLKADFPGVKVAAIGTIAKAQHAQRHRYWNSQVVSKLDHNLIDAITVHFYHNNRPPSGFNSELGIGQTIQSWNRAWTQRAAGGENFDRVPIERNKLDDWNVWYTEYGAFQHDIIDMWHYSFYMSNVLDSWLRHTRVQKTTLHSWKTSVKADYTIKPFVRAMSMWSQASKGQKKAGRLVLGNIPRIRGSQHQGVIGWMFSGGGKPRLIFVNYTENTHNLDLSNIDHDRTNEMKISSVSSKLLEGKVAPPVENRSQQSPFVAILPFSITVVEGIEHESNIITQFIQLMVPILSRFQSI